MEDSVRGARAGSAHRFDAADEAKAAIESAAGMRTAPRPPDHGRFYLQIYGLEAFAIFVAIIRGDDQDDEKLRRLTKLLNRSTDDLEKAEHNAARVK
jgi:hypothetical protein